MGASVPKEATTRGTPKVGMLILPALAASAVLILEGEVTFWMCLGTGVELRRGQVALLVALVPQSSRI